MSRLATHYQSVRTDLQQELGIANVNQIPKLEKIVINSGVGKAAADSKHLDTVVETLTKISAQKPIITKARHSIAGFKLREGVPIGAKVVLRGQRMYDFLDRLIAVVLPRMRDFRGLSTDSFDKSGNYHIGISDQTVFPEIAYEDLSSTHGLQITLVVKGDKQASKALLTKLGLPLKKGEK